MSEKMPKYKDLPKYNETEEHYSWGLFGEEDELGTQNFLTSERVLGAVKLVERGDWFPLSWNMEYPDPTFFTRDPMRFTHIDLGHLHPGSDDVYDNYYSQASTQWDALNHVGTLDREMYNGWSEESVHKHPWRLGMQNMGRRGIAGAYTLIDVKRFLESVGKPLDLRARTEITSKLLDECLEWQKTSVSPGDIVLIHTGWTKYYSESPKDVKDDIGYSSQSFQCEFPGLEPTRDTAEWLWDHQVSCIVTDTPAVESGPFTLGSYDTFLHYRLIGLLGITLGEFFYLADLAEACESDKRYRGLFAAAPFNKLGGAGSPGNALAIR